MPCKSEAGDRSRCRSPDCRSSKGQRSHSLVFRCNSARKFLMARWSEGVPAANTTPSMFGCPNFQWPLRVLVAMKPNRSSRRRTFFISVLADIFVSLAGGRYASLPRPQIAVMNRGARETRSPCASSFRLPGNTQRDRRRQQLRCGHPKTYKASG